MSGCSLECCCDERCASFRCDNRDHSLFTTIKPEGLNSALDLVLLSVDREQQQHDRLSDETVLAADRELERNTKFQDKISAVAHAVQASLETLRQRSAQIEASKAQAVGRMDFHDAEAVRRVSRQWSKQCVLV